MKKNIYNLIIFSAIISILFMSFVSAVPKIEPYVNDFANLLSQEQETNLNLLSDKIEINTTYEIAIVTLENTEGLDRITYANKLGDENGVGKKDKDNGIVVLWSNDNEKGLAIATGRYSESIINDAKAGRILRSARHYFDEGNYYEGFLNITNELNNEIVGVNLENIKEYPPSPNSDFSWWLILIPMGLFAFVLILKPLLAGEDFSETSEESNSDRTYKYKKVNGKRKRVYLYGAVASSVLSSRSSGSSSSSSSGSSGGFSGGFSGGSFGGGGARG